MSPLIKRVVSGMGANAYGQMVNIVIQLASLPIFLSQWDLKTYGMWLTLSAIPAYFSMADVGMVSVAGTRMTMLIGAGNQKAANSTFQSAQVFVGIACAAMAIIALPLITWAPLDVLKGTESQAALLALVLVVLFSMASGLTNAVYKATHRYALGMFIDTNTRLLEWAGGLIGFFWQGTFLAVALGMLSVRVFMLFIVGFLSTKNVHELKWGVRDANLNEIRRMIVPSLGYMSFPISNALSFQGFTLMAAAIFGPVTVAVFNIYRTIARIAVQMTSVLSHALAPELSRLYGGGLYEKFKNLALQFALIGGVGAIILSFGIYFVSPYLLDFWTKGKVSFMPLLMSLFLLYAAIAGAWHIPRIVLMAVNRHSQLGLVVLMVSISSLFVAKVLGEILGIEGLVVAMIVGELCVAIACFWFAKKVIQERLRARMPSFADEF